VHKYITASVTFAQSHTPHSILTAIFQINLGRPIACSLSITAIPIGFEEDVFTEWMPFLHPTNH